MAGRITTSELEKFVLTQVQLTGTVLGRGAYGSVEEVEIPGVRVAAKKLHPALVNLDSPYQVHNYNELFISTLCVNINFNNVHAVPDLSMCSYKIIATYNTILSAVLPLFLCMHICPQGFALYI